MSVYNPEPKAERMSPSQAAYVSKRGRDAVRNGTLTHHQFAVIEILLWDCRDRGADRVQASYSWLVRKANVCRETVADAVTAGLALGLFQKIKRKVLTLWHNGGRKWEQRPNLYVFCCKSAGSTEYTKQEIKIVSIAPNRAEFTAAVTALADRARVIQARMLKMG